MLASPLPDGELAFTYFPGNYRWSHGVLIALGGAPWGGAEIDEVNRVGRALRDKIGDDNAWFEEWARMAKEHPAFYGDLSVFGLPVHGRPLRRILRDPGLVTKVLYGSDFPAAPLPLWYVLRLGWRKARALGRLENPFDAAYLTLKELGVPDEVFTRAGSLLRSSK